MFLTKSNEIESVNFTTGASKIETTLTGIDAIFSRAKMLSAMVGSFTLTGIDIIATFSGWTKRTKPSDSVYTKRTKPTTNWTKRTKP